MLNRFDAHLHRHLEVARTARETLGPVVAEAAALVICALESGHKVLLCGNGGSAADAQHIAAELTGRYEVPGRRALPALALSTDSSAVTAISNDLGFEQVFARQIQALGQAGDVLVGISTSGCSPNVVAAVSCAKLLGLKTIGLLGRDGGDLRTLVDLPIVVQSPDTPHIQEMHITIGHVLCGLVDDAFQTNDPPHQGAAQAGG
jgi:D-sedoheptulose 7-phosphate isomerase